MNKTPPKTLRQPRRNQTARMLQQIRRLTLFVADMNQNPGQSTVARMNTVLASETPAETVSTDGEAVSKLLMGVAIGFPSLVLVFLEERFKKNKGMSKRFASVLAKELKTRQHENPPALRIIKLKIHRTTHGFKLASGESKNDAIMRHLRNCFAHGNWQVDVTQNNASQFRVRLVDYDTHQSGSDKRTFQAEADLMFLLDITEKLLLTAFEYLA